MSILKLFAFLSLASSNAFAPQQRSSQTLNHPESCVTRSVLRDAVSDDVVGINHTEASIDEVLVIPKPKLSKGKWKKKRYLMMQDVRLKIQQKSPRAPHKAAEMIRRMLTLYEKSGGDTDFLPDLQAYNLWIHALAKSKSENAGVLAEEVMEKMRMNQIWPDVITYTSVMDAHAQSQSPEMAEDVLFRLLDEAPAERLNYSSVTSDTILNALAQQGTRESAQRAQMILYRLEEWKQGDIRPTKISYSTVINAWAKVGSAEAAGQAEGLLRRMLRPNAANALRPDKVVFNAAINAWATSKDPSAGNKALDLMRLMRKLAAEEGYDTSPDIVTYNTVLSAWSHSGDENAAPLTEKIVQEMKKVAKKSDEAPVPNTVTYNTILHAWSKSTLEGAAERAQKVLEFMIKSDKQEIAPDVISFTSVLDAWAKSKEPRKCARTRDLLDELLELYETTKRPSLRPSPIPYNSVLNACAFSAIGTSTEEQQEALQIAVNTFSNMRKSDVRPDTVTYGNMIKCMTNLVPLDNINFRTKMTIQVFEKSIEEGLVGTLVWNEIRRAVPSKILEERFKLKSGSCGYMQLKELPKSWKRNRSEKNAPKDGRKPRDKEGSPPPAPKPTTTIIETSFQSDKE